MLRMVAASDWFGKLPDSRFGKSLCHDVLPPDLQWVQQRHRETVDHGQFLKQLHHKSSFSTTLRLLLQEFAICEPSVPGRFSS